MRPAAALVFALLAFGARAQAQVPADEAQIKAAFVYNFLKFVEWPEAAAHRGDEPVVVAIVGEGTTAEAVATFLAARHVGDRPIVIRRLLWDQSLAGVNAVFVSEGDPKKLRRLLDAAATAAVLSIGESPNFASRGGVIGLLVEERRVRFDIDTDAADAAGLHVSSKLLALCRVIRSAKNGENP